MKIRKIETTLFMAVLAFAVVACSGSGTQMIQTHMEEAHVGKPIGDVLIIAILDNQKIREIYEKHVMDWLSVKGVDAVISADVLPTNLDTKLEKEAIIDLVDKYKNDTIWISRLVGWDETEVFSRDRPRYYRNYYGFYNYGWGGYVTWPTIYGEKVQFSIETRLYDVKTESLIWAGESQTKNPETTGQAIGQVVDAVMKALEKNGLLPKTP